MPDIAVAAVDVSKRFVNYHERATSLKERILRRRATSHSDFWALRDVTVEVARGETVGLMGANGSGKSTLLKVMAGILRPTTGTVRSRGRIASLLELGAGFNGELSGRENIFLNASLLGLTRKETAGLYEAIVDFSELGQFVDSPVKHYSSGMYVRLGFAVAVHVDPEILLVDEVLAVGDEHFQRKCLDKISQFQDQGRTILFVSHSSALVERVCSRAVILDHGRTVFEGDPSFASAELSRILGTDVPASRPDETPLTGIRIGKMSYSKDPGGAPVDAVSPGDSLVVRVPIEVDAHWAAQIGSARMVIMGVGDIPVFAMAAGRSELPATPGQWAVDFVIPNFPPIKGRFVAAFQLSRPTGEAIAAVRSTHAFEAVATHRTGILGVDYRVESRSEALA